MKKVLSLGQCGVDHPMISRVFRTHLNAEVVGTDSFAEAIEQLRQQHFDLVLVNRILAYDGQSGLDFIGQLKADPALASTPVMLVSNYADAQKQAVQLGALPGFGKAELNRPETRARLREMLNAEPVAAPKNVE